jgi:two-component system response regulator VicR
MSGERILIVEDDRAVARGLEYALRSEGFTTLQTSTAAEALETIRRHDPHLILLDIRLPDMSGFDVCRQLRAEGRLMPILMLTARDDETDRVLGLELGADDYVVKPFGIRELISRIRALLRRTYGEFSARACEGRISFGEIEVDLEALRVLRDGKPVDLTPTEFRLLRYLLLHADRPLSREALIEAVWGYDCAVGSQRTVDVHIRHLREKLEPEPSDPRWLVTLRGIGYIFQS